MTSPVKINNSIDLKLFIAQFSQLWNVRGARSNAHTKICESMAAKNNQLAIPPTNRADISDRG
jgi:hypothetical protein